MHTKASTGKIQAHRNRFDVRTMCRGLEVAPSGYSVVASNIKLQAGAWLV
jgi:hypothetical protein